MRKRRILIIPASAKASEFKAIAQKRGCFEIVAGIPAILRDKIKVKDLPLVYEEEQHDNALSLEQRIQELEAVVKELQSDKGKR